MRSFIFGLLASLALGASAQDGPDIPCHGCAQASQFSLPASGWWYNPDQSGVGLNLEFQGDMLIGSYYGYLPDGTAQWYVFAGPLERSAEPGQPAVRVRATLQDYFAGACVGCVYQEPARGPEERSITLEFNQAHHATFVIDGAPQQNVVPLLLGVSGAKHFSDVLDYTFPNLEGNWVFLLNNPEQRGPWGTRAYSFYFTGPSESTTDDGIVRRVIWYVDEYAVGPEIYSRGDMQCNREFLDESRTYGMPTCKLRLLAQYPGVPGSLIEFPISIANIGEKRVFAADPVSGITVEAIRVSYDLDYAE